MKKIVSILSVFFLVTCTILVTNVLTRKKQAEAIETKKVSTREEERASRTYKRPTPTFEQERKMLRNAMARGLEERRLKEAKERAEKAARKEAAAKAREERLARELARKATPKPSVKKPMPPAPKPKLNFGSPKQYAMSRVGAGQFSCLNALWMKESGWNHTAMNPSSGAYGIPQALPGGKMASAGADWRTNPITQVRWGLSYISSRYGTPCAAWAHSQRHNWY